MTKIIFTGPESSGKTYLSSFISQKYFLPLASEFAREYLTKINRPYNQNDLLFIAKKQLKNEQNSIIIDTDLITIKIWSEYKYGICENWILEQILQQKKENRIYILCSPDFPWQPDPLREHPKNRDEIFKIYQSELESLGYKYYICEGKKKKREEEIKNLICSILNL